MLEEYDIDKLNPRPNPYAKELKKQVTIKISPSVIDYFKKEAAETGIPYQTLINLYLVDCVNEKKKLNISWKKQNTNIGHPCGDALLFCAMHPEKKYRGSSHKYVMDYVKDMESELKKPEKTEFLSLTQDAAKKLQIV